MIRLTCAAAMGLLCWLSVAAAQTPPSTAGAASDTTVEELVLANRILNDAACLMPMAMSASVIQPIQTAI